jgi:hypothetical protein
LWHFDGATGGELPWIWRVNNGSTYVRSVVVTKDVLIFNHKEQDASMRRVGQNLSNYPLICSSHCLSFFLGPICRQWSSIVLSASDDDIIYDVGQVGVISEDNITIIQNITTIAREYCGRESIVFGMVTDSGVGPNSYQGNGWIAIYGPRSEPQTINNRADIGAELPMFGIDGGVGLLPSGIRESSSFSNGDIRLGDDGKGVCMLLVSGSFRLSDDRPIVAVRNSQSEDRSRSGGDKSPKSKPFAFAFTALVAVGLVTISGLFSRYAVYACRDRSDSSYYFFMLFSFLAIFGGFFLVATIFGFFPESPLPHLNLF